jgi:hypothetical protein
MVERTRGTVEPTRFMVEPTRRIVDRTRWIVESTCRMAERTRWIVDPTRGTVEQTGFIVDPTGRMVDPTRPIVDPTRFIVAPPKDGALDREHPGRGGVSHTGKTRAFGRVTYSCLQAPGLHSPTPHTADGASPTRTRSGRKTEP